MPNSLLILFLKYVAPLIISWLRKEGYINAAEGLAARGAVWTIEEVKSLKTYQEYPEQHDKFGG